MSGIGRKLTVSPENVINQGIIMRLEAMEVVAEVVVLGISRKSPKDGEVKVCRPIPSEAR